MLNNSASCQAIHLSNVWRVNRENFPFTRLCYLPPLPETLLHLHWLSARDECETWFATTATLGCNRIFWYSSVYIWEQPSESKQRRWKSIKTENTHYSWILYNLIATFQLYNTSWVSDIFSQLYFYTDSNNGKIYCLTHICSYHVPAAVSLSTLAK